MVCVTYMKFVAQTSELKVAETYIKVIEIIKLNKHRRMLEELMDQWPFLINDVLLHHNPNDVWEWEKQVALWADNDDKVWFVSLVAQLSELKVAETYIKLIKIIIPRKATLNYHNIFFAKFYEQCGVMSMVAPDLDSAR